MIFGGDIKSHFLVFGDSEHEAHADMMAVFRKVSKGSAGKLVHVYVNSGKADNGRILEFFGIKKEDGQVTRIIQVRTFSRITFYNRSIIKSLITNLSMSWLASSGTSKDSNLRSINFIFPTFVMRARNAAHRNSQSYVAMVMGLLERLNEV